MSQQSPIYTHWVLGVRWGGESVVGWSWVCTQKQFDSCSVGNSRTSWRVNKLNLTIFPILKGQVSSSKQAFVSGGVWQAITSILWRKPVVSSRYVDVVIRADEYTTAVLIWLVMTVTAPPTQFWVWIPELHQTVLGFEFPNYACIQIALCTNCRRRLPERHTVPNLLLLAQIRNTRTCLFVSSCSRWWWWATPTPRCNLCSWVEVHHPLVGKKVWVYSCILWCAIIEGQYIQNIQTLLVAGSTWWQ